ncbi:MAG: CDP-alcohol phosphatidyltransferase family protein [Euzebyales bacterium]|nr:CDP-alcohol phosphatidyltransferase family protein [Euzebyales bacterium]
MDLWSPNSQRVLALVASGLVLVSISLATARRPSAPVPDREGYFARWQVLHGGYDPRTGNPWLRGWLTMSFVIARPLARRGILPDMLTVWSLWLAFAVFVPAAAGGYWAMLAGWTLVASGLGDTLDGCVAVLTDRATRWGYVLDSAVDRVNDLIYLVAVVAVGGHVILALICATAFFLLEYLRARAANAGGGEIGAVTLGERANRVVLCSAAIHFGGVFVDHAELVATLGLAALAAFSVVGLGQLLHAVHRQLAGLPSP